MRVLVTRPEPAASRTADMLRSLEYEPVLLPLSRIVALPVDTPMNTVGTDAVVVTSANAIHHAPGELLQRLFEAPVFCVGKETAAAARVAGAGQVLSADGDVDALVALIASHITAPATLVYLCGQVRRPGVEEALATLGHRVEALETYDSVEMLPGADALSDSLGSIDAVLVFSANNAASLNRLVRVPEAASVMAHATYFCLSPRVAEALDVEAARLRIAARPDQASLIGLLDPAV